MSVDLEEANGQEPDIKPDRSVINFAIAMGSIVLLLLLVSIFAEDLRRFFNPEKPKPTPTYQPTTSQTIEQSPAADDQAVKESLIKFIEAFFVDQKKGYFDPPSYFAPITETYYNYHNLTYQQLKQAHKARSADLLNLELNWLVHTLSFERRNDTLVVSFWTKQSYFKPSKSAQEKADVLLEMSINKEGKISTLKEVEVRNLNSDFIGGSSSTVYREPSTPPSPETKENTSKSSQFSDNQIYNSGLLDVAPEFPGGEKKLMRYLNKNIQYPTRAKQQQIQGWVFVGFVVEPNGTLSNLKIIRGIGSGCDEEALRAVRNSPPWNPGRLDDKAVRTSYVLPIRFQLMD